MALQQHAFDYAGQSAPGLGEQIHRRGAVDGLARRWWRAAELIEAQPDEAALLLDGLLGEIVEDWCLHHEQAPGDAAEMLRLIERWEPLFGWRLRLALRAPNGRARLEHCAALLAMLPGVRAPVGDAGNERGCRDDAGYSESGGGVAHR